MTDTDIVTKAINKALDNGWDGFDTAHRGRKQWHVIQSPSLHNKVFTPTVVTTIQGFESTPYEQRATELLYRHDFAKSLWGEGESTKDSFGGSVEFYDFGGEQWQYHLMAMVVADNPIEYLKQNI